MKQHVAFTTERHEQERKQYNFINQKNLLFDNFKILINGINSEIVLRQLM
jgi:hypothetical protein